jgi:hypothetical protein
VLKLPIAALAAACDILARSRGPSAEGALH